MLGAELIEAHPVVPVAEGHALAIGIFRYRDRLHFGLFADPDVFPQVRHMPEALGASLHRLLSPEVQSGMGRPRRRPIPSTAQLAEAAVAASALGGPLGVADPVERLREETLELLEARAL